MSIIPSFDLCYLSNLALFAAAVVPHVPQPKRQMWILSTLNGTLVTLIGLYESYRWWMTGDLTTTPLSIAVLEFMKCYLLVDLAYNAIFHRQHMGLLECWVHHSVYIFAFDQLIQQGFAGVIRPLFILELPAAIRSWGSLIPAIRSDYAFGATFGILRVAYPFYVAYYLTLPTWAWLYLAAAQTLHIYWFSQWIKKYGLHND